MDELRQRAKRKKIRVTFPDGKAICHGNVTDTLLAVLCEIGSDRFPEINLELCHLPILSKEIYPRYKNWMKPVCDGWYLNTQSDTDMKYIQLRSINDSLQLGLVVEIGYDFETTKKADKTKRTRTKDNLLVRFPDGEYIANPNSMDTYLGCLWKIGIEEIKRKGIECGGNPLVTTFKATNKHFQVDVDRWAIVPGTTRDRAKMLRILATHFKLNLEITII